MASSALNCWAEIARPRFSTLDAITNDVFNSNRQKALQIVKAELLNLRRVLSVVRWLRNGCRPVSHIPPEILAHIFWFCRHDPTRGLEDGARCIIAVSHVCHRWRKAALDHAYLWGTVTSLALGEKWMAEMLRRAKEAPLMIHSSAMPSPQSKPVKPLNLSLLLPLLSRIERLEISDHVDDLAGFLRLLVKPAPILESLVHIQEGTDGSSKFPHFIRSSPPHGKAFWTPHFLDLSVSDESDHAGPASTTRTSLPELHTLADAIL